MMKIETSRFGEIEIQEDNIIDFPWGIPGFEHIHSYIMIRPNEELPFSFMQAVEDKDLDFLVINPFHVYADYEFQLQEDIQGELKVASEQDIAIWSIVSIPEKFEDATINLLAPIIVNKHEQVGRQIILHQSSYKTKHTLFPAQSKE